MRYLLLLLALLAWPAQAQTKAPSADPQTFSIYVDTAGIVPVDSAPNVYMTWVFAKTSPGSYPSSGVLVKWDCSRKMVKRLAQVVYKMNADSSGVTGDIQEVSRQWQAVSDERLSSIICTIGSTHVGKEILPGRTDSLVTKPKSPYPEA